REWDDAARAEDAAAALRLTAEDVLAVGFCDAVVDEPRGGSHRDPRACAKSVLQALRRHLAALTDLSAEDRIAARRKRLATLAQLVAVSG
ncbi:MAG: acetyl-CoA carboxylase carboxyl transferase subunit alpha, partial [Pseudomonadota bacterium]